MMLLVLFFLASFGVAFVLGHSKISLPFRKVLGGWVESSIVNDIERGETIGKINHHKPLVPLLGPFLVALVECPACLGFWVGGAVALWHPAIFYFFTGTLSLDPIIEVLLLAFSTSAVNLLLAKYTGILHDDT